MDPMIIAMVGVGGTITGVLLGAWITYKFSLFLSQRAEKHSASLKLRQAFKDEILALNPAHHAIDDDIPVFLKNAFSRHEAAVYDFSFFLKTKTKTAFYKAWQEYYCHPDARNENTIPFLEQYSCRGLTISQIHDMKNLVKSRLEAILRFAEKT